MVFILVPISFSVSLFVMYIAKHDDGITKDDAPYPFCIAFSAIFELSLIVLVAITQQKMRSL